MSAETLRAMCRTRDIKIGHFIVGFATPGIGHIIKSAGCDFALLDMEHSGFAIETVKSVLRYMQAAGLPTIVRPPSREYHHIARICDMGAEGVMTPMVGTAAEAKRIVESIKYHPEGRRGMALQIAHDDYRPGPVADKLAAANKRTMVVIQIETAEGVANVDEIAGVDGVDCLWVGHFDLSTSLGVPGQFDSPVYLDAIEKVKAAVKKHDRALGLLVPGVDEGVARHAEGFDFICYSGDVWVLHNALADAVRQLKSTTGRS